MGLEGLMRPRSIALVGASEKKGFGYWTAYNLLQSKDQLRSGYWASPAIGVYPSCRKWWTA